MRRILLLLLAGCGGAIATPPSGDAGSTVTPAPTASPTSAVDAAPPGPTVACGGGSCSGACCTDLRTGREECRTAGDACRGHRVSCDETTDCPAGDVCCAEIVEEGGGLETAYVSACRRSCTTGIVRVKVCQRDDECESGSCRAYACATGLPTHRYCELPEFCR